MVIAKSEYYPEFFTEGLKRLFFNIYDTTPLGDYGRITTVVPSDKDKEEYAGIGTVPKLSEWKDERKVLSLGDMFKYEIVNKRYEVTLGVPRTVLEDEQYGQIKLKIQDIAQEVRRAYDEYAFGMLKSGTSLNCFDGGYFFRTTHDNGSGNQSNALSTAFSKTALQTAITTMRRYKDDKGRILAIQPDTLIVSPELEWSAKELLNASSFIVSKQITADSTGALTPNYNSVQGALNLMVSPYLTSATEWYVACTTKSIKPIIMQTRVAPEFDALDNASATESVFMRDEYLYGIRTRFGLGFGPWMYCIQGNA